ncbi:MAG: protein-(glutamine-N5) methyltransferase, release factor-specific [Candidatus Doudnabacteria bacterium RIFCSPLOWO2_01_FULL_44_21]|uniref:Protein-(Glutamine-N5) methyltransferase, release factor-specific n=1 Tax=Candidatus Doudnabacteria bacterium RIFCSPLOWO2_01_FULL_44_21 TaxID=1817841 RepID=A0A1F5PXY9_9BACT|nr:MAG: protein-(glutamine-N5) methyltransferase, release factor-specific [Candidatus Doudnabacteria bacterium RIFCSPHIGHO2_02_FULL_43_13b]OGE94724.1 MAG: protein-(glutamine-N5) methyltransferase, release factor-specific [Candidatus Doudnabacteria bacterium RIFCSPLOWO2_01_FULL_44_21]
MTLNELISFGTTKLSKTSDSATLDSEVLLAYVLKKPKEYLSANPKQFLLSNKLSKYKRLIDQRAKGWPVAYLTGHKEFFGLDFILDKNVLIPRPETESLVELVLEKIKDKKTKIKILDIGTGSGNIIVALAKVLSFVFASGAKQSHSRVEIASSLRSSQRQLFFASDISTASLRVARQNAKRHKVKINFKTGDLLKPWKNQSFDIIVANLPYLARKTDPSTKFEPKTALVAKNQGLALYEELFKSIARSEATRQSFIRSPRDLRSLAMVKNTLPAFVFVEIGHNQATQIKSLAKKCLPGFQVTFFKDLSDRVRYCQLQK